MANEKRLIDANEIKGDFSFLRKMWSGTEIIAVIDDAPTVDAVEVVHGWWMPSKSMVKSFKCSMCKGCVTKHSVDEPDFNYCPNCGAKMDGGK